MRWIWVRHGETEENRFRRYLGQADPLLNSRGEEQAERLAQRLSRLQIDAVYTSDLQRCMQTAVCIAKRYGLVPIASRALRELAFGRWEGKTYEAIMAADAELAVRWYADPFAVSPPEGEDLRTFGERIDHWLAGIMAVCDPCDTVAIVSHGGVIRWFQSRWLHGDPGRFWQTEGIAHGETMTVVWNGSRWQVDRLDERNRI